MPTSALKLRQITKFGQNGTVVANISYDCRHASEEGARVALVGPQEPLDRADTEVKASSSTLVLRCNNNKTDLTAMTHRLTAVGTTKVDSTLCVRCKESFFNGPFFTLYGDHAPGIFFCTLSNITFRFQESGTTLPEPQLLGSLPWRGRAGSRSTRPAGISAWLDQDLLDSKSGWKHLKILRKRDRQRWIKDRKSGDHLVCRYVTQTLCQTT